MQDKKMKTEIVLLAVPAEMLLEAGIFEGDPMQMYVDGNKLVILPNRSRRKWNAPSVSKSPQLP